MSDIVPTLGRREERERGRGERGDVIEGARSRSPQEGFQFRERHLNRIEVGTVGRQKSDLRAGGFDGHTHLWLFVDGEIVEHHDIAAPERRDEHLLHVGPKAGGVDGPSNTAGAVSPWDRSAATIGCVSQCPHGV